MSPAELRALYGEYLEHSLRYYELDRPVISDSRYDEICNTLLAQWGLVEHKFKYLTDESALYAGSGFQLVGKPELDPILWLCRLNPNVPLQEVYGK